MQRGEITVFDWIVKIRTCLEYVPKTTMKKLRAGATREQSMQEEVTANRGPGGGACPVCSGQHCRIEASKEEMIEDKSRRVMEIRPCSSL